MIKTLIIDDDVEMLQGLANIINWEDYGFSIAGKAQNGFEGLNIISELMPDLIITDITMPLMNGLDLIREAKKFNPDIKSIIISCHEDFNYAREAIRLEADEYILKHTLTRDELISVITKLKDKIDYELSQRENLNEAMHKLNTNKHVILEKFFSDIVENNTGWDQTAPIHIALPTGNFRLISLFVDNMDAVLLQQPIQEYNLFKFCILNIIEEIIDGNDHINFFSYEKNTFGLLYWDHTKEITISREIISIVKEIQTNVQLFLKFKLSVCFSSVYTYLSCLKKALKETEALRDQYFYKEPGEIITTANACKEYSNHVYEKFGSEFKNALRIQNRTQITECTNQLFDMLASEQYEPNRVRALLRRLMADAEVIFGKYQISMETFQIEGDTFSKYRKDFEGAIQHMFKKLSESGNISARSEIKRVIGYMEAHIHEEISCESMANYVNMNSNYFSRLFKSEMGVSFSDYMINKRMNVATELLINSDYSIEEITKAIGIESISYFYRAYKKITGYTPGDVRSKGPK